MFFFQFDGFQKEAVQMVKPAKGTTTLAFIFKEGVIVAADSRASMGGYICMFIHLFVWIKFWFIVLLMYVGEGMFVCLFNLCLGKVVVHCIVIYMCGCLWNLVFFFFKD